MEEAVPPPEARLADEVRAMKPSARRKRAKAAGAAEEEIEACDDADDPVAAFVELISRYETPPSAEELLAVEIGAMKPSARLKWALAAGATEEEAEEAGDADEPVAAYATLIAQCAQKKNEAAHKAALAVELGAMKPSARKRRAVAAGATEDAIDEAMDANDPVAAFVDILLLLAPQPSAAEPAAATELPHLAAEIPQQKVAASHAGAATSQQLGGGAFGDKHIMLSYQCEFPPLSSALIEVSASGSRLASPVQGACRNKSRKRGRCSRAEAYRAGWTSTVAWRSTSTTRWPRVCRTLPVSCASLHKSIRTVTTARSN
jgi:hypothetical protein